MAARARLPGLRDHLIATGFRAQTRPGRSWSVSLTAASRRTTGTAALRPRPSRRRAVAAARQAGRARPPRPPPRLPSTPPRTACARQRVLQHAREYRTERGDAIVMAAHFVEDADPSREEVRGRNEQDHSQRRQDVRSSHWPARHCRPPIFSPPEEVPPAALSRHARQPIRMVDVVVRGRATVQRRQVARHRGRDRCLRGWMARAPKCG